LIAGTTRPYARTRPGTLEITDDRVFGPGAESLARRFAQRVLAFTEIQSLALDPTRARATLNYRLATRRAGCLPDPARRCRYWTHRRGEQYRVTALDRWRASHPLSAFQRHPGFCRAEHCERAAEGPPSDTGKQTGDRASGKKRVAGRTEVIKAIAIGDLRVRFDPHALRQDQ
jgi:hypothetical protein